MLFLGGNDARFALSITGEFYVDMMKTKNEAEKLVSSFQNTVAKIRGCKLALETSLVGMPQLGMPQFVTMDLKRVENLAGMIGDFILKIEEDMDLAMRLAEKNELQEEIWDEMLECSVNIVEEMEESLEQASIKCFPGWKWWNAVYENRQC